MVEQALPLWGTRGFDPVSGLFEERLGFDHSIDRDAPRRVMVQARQIMVFAEAAQRGWFAKGKDLAMEAGRRMVQCYHATDGDAGWIFSVDRTGRPVRTERDLYAHAFVLLALASLMRLEPDGPFRPEIDRTLAFLDQTMADPIHGGYWDTLPRQDALRRQNPHMHLFEAMLELYDVTRNPAILARGDALRSIARRRFYSACGGFVREYFTDDWEVHPPGGVGSVEPGHLCEWVSLVRRYEQLAGLERQDEPASLLRSVFAFAYDTKNGRIVDEIGEDGAVRQATSRLWPHTEAIRALELETRAGVDHGDDVRQLVRRLMSLFCPTHLGGGWIDRLDAHDDPISITMPASSLYHLYTAAATLAA